MFLIFAYGREAPGQFVKVVFPQPVFASRTCAKVKISRQTGRAIHAFACPFSWSGEHAVSLATSLQLHGSRKIDILGRADSRAITWVKMPKVGTGKKASSRNSYTISERVPCAHFMGLVSRDQ